MRLTWPLGCEPSREVSSGCLEELVSSFFLGVVLDSINQVGQPEFFFEGRNWIGCKPLRFECVFFLSFFFFGGGADQYTSGSHRDRKKRSGGQGGSVSHWDRRRLAFSRPGMVACDALWKSLGNLPRESLGVPRFRVFQRRRWLAGYESQGTRWVPLHISGRLLRCLAESRPSGRNGGERE